MLRSSHRCLYVHYQLFLLCLIFMIDIPMILSWIDSNGWNHIEHHIDATSPTTSTVVGNIPIKTTTSLKYHTIFVKHTLLTKQPQHQQRSFFNGKFLFLDPNMIPRRIFKRDRSTTQHDYCRRNYDTGDDYFLVICKQKQSPKQRLILQRSFRSMRTLPTKFHTRLGMMMTAPNQSDDYEENSSSNSNRRLRRPRSVIASTAPATVATSPPDTKHNNENPAKKIETIPNTKSKKLLSTKTKVDNLLNNNNTNISKKDINYSARYYAAKALMPRNHNDEDIPSFAVDRLESNLQYQTLLSARDRSFSRLLVSTTERRIGQIDYVLRMLSSHDPIKKKKNKNKINTIMDAHVQAALRIGIAQLLFLPTIPSYAAVKETIDVLRMTTDVTIPETKIQYVNAILRRITRDGIDALLQKTNITMNVSPWLLQQLYDDWGYESTHTIIQMAMEESPRYLTMNYDIIHHIISNQTTMILNRSTGDSDGDNDYDHSDDENNDDRFQHYHCNNGMKYQQQKDIAYFVDQYFPNSTILPQGSVMIHQSPSKQQPILSDTTNDDANHSKIISNTISSWPYYKEGAWWCQDPSATIPSLGLYQTLRRQYGTIHDLHVIDLCASPGGKTAQLYNYGFRHIEAIDISQKRIERLIENQKRLQMNWNTVLADGTTYIPDHSMIHGVLLDVPCTATGTASKHPDVLRRMKHRNDIQSLLQTQYELACHTIEHILDIGSVCIYSTCSILQQESEEQVLKLMNHYNSDENDRYDYTIQMIPFDHDEIPGIHHHCIHPQHGWIRILPGHETSHSLHKIDGFFVARFQKVYNNKTRIV